MHTVGDARGVNQTFHTLEHEHVLKAEGRVVSKVNPNASEILDLLEVPVPESAGARQTRSSDETVLTEALEKLAPTRLLEVGATDADLVLASTASERVAVSPRFAFDPRTYASSDVAFYELDLGRYADLFHGERRRFDVIRIVGDDFADVMAAFRVSKRLGHPGTTWLLGSGRTGARAAVAVRVAHPGYTAKRVVVQRTSVFVVERVRGEPTKDAGVGKLSDREIARRTRRIPLTRLHPASARTRGVRGRLADRVRAAVHRGQA